MAHVLTTAQMTTSFVVTTIAGTTGVAGATDGTPGTFNTPSDVAVHASDSALYITELANHTVRRLALATGAVSTVAGSAGVTGSTNATGTSARFNSNVLHRRHVG